MAEDINVVEIDGVTVVTVQVESLMGLREVERLAAEMEGQIGGGVSKLVLDMSHTRYAGSAALGVIIAAQKRIKTAGGKMVMVQSDPITQLLKIARTQSIFTAAPNLNEAVRMLQR